jgi:hypothetical protein
MSEAAAGVPGHPKSVRVLLQVILDYSSRWCRTHHWFLGTVTAICLIATVYFVGIQANSPLSFGDLTPWTNLAPAQAGSVYAQVYRTQNIPGQFTVGLGATNALTPYLMLQTVLAFIVGSVPLAEVVFYWAIIPLAGISFWLLGSIWTRRPAVRALTSGLYSLNPLPLLILLPGGNPSEFVWYAFIPLIVHGTIRFIQRGNLKYAYEAVVALLLSGVVLYEYSVLSVGFVVIPVVIVFLLTSLERRTILRSTGILLATISAAGVTILVNAALLGYLEGGLGSSGGAFFDQIQPGFPSALQLVLYDVPSLGATFYWPYGPTLEGTAIFAVIAVAVWIVVLFPMIGLKRRDVGGTSLIPTVIGLSVLFLYFGNWTGLSRPLYGTIQPFDLIDWPIKLFPLVVLMVVCNCLFSIEFLLERLGGRRSNAVDIGIAPSSRSGSRHLFQRIANGRPQLSATCLASSVILLVLSSATITSSVNLSAALNNSQPTTYVQPYVTETGRLLSEARQSAGIQNALDLWLPIDGDTTLQNSIISVDPYSLFFVNTLTSGIAAGNGQADSAGFSAYASSQLITNSTNQFGRYLAQEDVAFVVVLTANVTFHEPYTNWAGPPYTSKLFITSQGWIIGSPQAALQLIERQSNLKQVAVNQDAVIFENLDYLGPDWASQAALLTQGTELYNTSNPELAGLYDLPGAGHEGPTVVLSSENASGIGPNNSVELWNPLYRTTGMSTSLPTLSMLNSQFIHQASSGPIVELNNSTYSLLAGTVSDQALGGPPGEVVGGPPTFSGPAAVFTSGQAVQLPWNDSWSLWNRSSSSFSLSVWFDSQSTPVTEPNQPYRCVFSQGSAFSVFVNDRGTQAFMSVQWEHVLNTSFFGFAIEPNVWYLATLSYDGKVLRAYENATLIGTQDITDMVGFRPGFPFSIGNNGQYLNWPFGGSISDVRMLGYPIGSPEVDSIFDAGPFGGSQPFDLGALAVLELRPNQYSQGQLRLELPNPDVRTAGVEGAGSVELVDGESGDELANLQLNGSWSFINPTGLYSSSLILQGWSALLNGILVTTGIRYWPMITRILPVETGTTITSAGQVSASVAPGLNWVYLGRTYDTSWKGYSPSAMYHFQALTGNAFSWGVVPNGEPMTVHFQYDYVVVPSALYALYIPLLVGMAIPTSVRSWQKRRMRLEETRIQ